MKKIIILAITAALMCSAVVANATEFKVSGQFDVTAETLDNSGFAKDGDTQGVNFKERFRTQIDIIASENVNGVVYFEIGDVTWGNGDAGDLGTDGVAIETRRAYVNFTVPNTEINVSAGLMGLLLPNAVAGSPVFDDDVAAAVVSYDFNETFGMTAFFARPAYGDADTNGTVAYKVKDKYSDLDLFGLIASVDLEKVSIQPYAVYGSGDYDDRNASVFWLGTSVKANPVEKLSLGADAIYSRVNIDGNGATPAIEDIEGNGLFLAGFVSYDLDVVTPKLMAWWAQGKDGDDLGFVGFAGSFYPTTFGFDGNTGRSSADELSVDGIGTAGIALSFEDIQFIDKVTHKVIFAYMGFTGEDRDDDTAFEIDFVTDYQLYEALSATVELAYIMPNFEDKKDNKGVVTEANDENAFKAAVSLKYAF